LVETHEGELKLVYWPHRRLEKDLKAKKETKAYAQPSTV
jgi:hypothetical protein